MMGKTWNVWEPVSRVFPTAHAGPKNTTAPLNRVMSRPPAGPMRRKRPKKDAGKNKPYCFAAVVSPPAASDLISPSRTGRYLSGFNAASFVSTVITCFA